MTTKIDPNDTAMLLGIATQEGRIEAYDVVSFFASFLQQLRDLTEAGLLDCEGDVGEEVWTITDKGREQLRNSDTLLDFATIASKKRAS